MMRETTAASDYTPPEEFQIIILSGGMGNRLNPLTQDIPKCMLPIANHPLVAYQLAFWESHGFKGMFSSTCGCPVLI